MKDQTEIVLLFRDVKDLTVIFFTLLRHKGPDRDIFFTLQRREGPDRDISARNILSGDA